MKRALVLLVFGALMAAVPSSARAEIIGLGSISETTVGFQENGFYSGTQYDITGYCRSSVCRPGGIPTGPPRESRCVPALVLHLSGVERFGCHRVRLLGADERRHVVWDQDLMERSVELHEPRFVERAAAARSKPGS